VNRIAGLALAERKYPLLAVCLLRLGLSCEFWPSARPGLPLRHRIIGTNARRNVYAGQAAAPDGGGRQRSFVSRLRFRAIAVSSTSSFAPLKPGNRSRSSLRMRFICTNRIYRAINSIACEPVGPKIEVASDALHHSLGDGNLRYAIGVRTSALAVAHDQHPPVNVAIEGHEFLAHIR
jgi:hypothetical protein